MPLPHAITGGAPLDLGGRRWWLRITYRVLLDCEEASGIDLLAASTDVARPSAALLRVLLWAALRAAGASWSVAEVGGMLTRRNLFAAHHGVLAAWAGSMPERGPGAGGRAPGKAPRSWAAKALEVWAWATSRHGLGLSDEQWLEMTPRQLYALRAVQTEQMQREELLTGIIASTVANFGHRAPRRAMRAEAFMLHPYEHSEAEGGPVTGEMIMAALRPIKEELRKAS